MMDPYQKQTRSKALKVPGLELSGARVRRELEMAAQLEIDGLAIPVNVRPESHAALSRQNAFFNTSRSVSEEAPSEVCSPTHPQLKHQSRSDPEPTFHVKEIKAVQESCEVKDSNLVLDSVQQDDKSRIDISEQGRKARKHYRSSGYGTKSDDNSQNKSECSHSQMEEDDTLCHDGPDSDDVVFDETPNANKYGGMENNSATINSRLNPQQCRGCNEKSITRNIQASENDLASGSSSGSFQIEVESGQLDSTVTNKCTNDYNSRDSTMMKWRHSYDRFLADRFLLNHESGCKTMDSLFLLLIDRLRESAPRKKSQTSSRLQKGKEPLINLKQDSYSLESEVNSFYDPIIQIRLEQSSRCHDDTCQECAEMKNCLRAISDPNISIQTSLNQENCKILLHMYDHSINCCLLRCPFFWCDMIPKYLSSHEEILYLMKQRVEHHALEPFLDNVGKEEFIELDNRIVNYPQEDVDWNPLVRLGYSRHTVLALPTKQNTLGNLDLWIVKKVPLIEGESQRMLYNELRKLQDDGIVQHLWAASFLKCEIFVVCTLYAGVSLQEIIKCQPITSLSTLVDLMLQVITVLQHLHQRGILFLNWSGSNIIIDQVQKKAKLADFTSSTLIGQFQFDSAAVEAYLPHHLHPPELMELPRLLDEKSDVWGLGCLLHEMVKGKPVWYQFQHDTLDQLRKKMISSKCPVIPSSIKELNVVFKACWELKGSDRPHLEELKQLMVNALVRQQGESVNTTTINVFTPR